MHLTRSEEALISILKSGRIEARTPHGAGRNIPAVMRGHRSVCLTEMPLQALGRMTKERPWGVVFDKERLRALKNAQPVWYVGDPSPTWGALEAAMADALSDPYAPIWQITPFVDRVRSLQRARPYDWRWEREWRVRGHLEFELSEVRMVIADEDGVSSFFDEVTLGMPRVSSGSITSQWSGSFRGSFDQEITRMLGRFHEQFVPGSTAGVFWDREEQRYLSHVEIFDTALAMDEVFGEVSAELQGIVHQVIESTDTTWCRRNDLELAWE